MDGRPGPLIRAGLAALALLAAGGAARAEPAGGAPEPVEGALLPAGEGRAILKRACVDCHDLGGLKAYAGYYDEEKWRAMMVTMKDHGAQIDAAEIAVLAAYLGRHFGPPKHKDDAQGE